MTIKELIIAFEIPAFMQRMVMGAVIARKPELARADVKLYIDKAGEKVYLVADGITWWEGTFDQAEAWFNGQQKADAGSGPKPQEAPSPA